jgi:hypothetical protein
MLFNGGICTTIGNFYLLFLNECFRVLHVFLQLDVTALKSLVLLKRQK